MAARTSADAAGGTRGFAMREAPFAEPFARFEALLHEAAALDRSVLPEPTAFALGTVDADGRPAVRILLLKAVDEHGFVFYTNFESRKGRELQDNPHAALCFYWAPLERQVRVEGPAAPVADAEADAYFASRPRGSQIGAWASTQSRDEATAGLLETRFAEFERTFEGRPVPRPSYWSGFRVAPERIEFWRGMPSRLHERQLYVRDGNRWRVRTLFP
jgi:pyridoxamine 5'-phosphate oxidase